MEEPVSEKQLKLRAKWKRSYWRNRTKKLARGAIFRANNLEKVRKQRRDWQRNNWPYRQEYMRKYYAARRDKIIILQRLRYKTNKKRYAATVMMWRAKNPDKVKQYSKNYYPKALEYGRKWRSRNRGAWAAKSSCRRAMQRRVTINKVQIEEWMQRMRSMESARCYYCDSLVPGNKIHFDHIVAIRNGGEHSITNLCVSCRTCNLTKGVKNLLIWKRYGQMVLSI